jgi:hypothetical protein
MQKEAGAKQTSENKSETTPTGNPGTRDATPIRETKPATPTGMRGTFSEDPPQGIDFDTVTFLQRHNEK